MHAPSIATAAITALTMAHGASAAIDWSISVGSAKGRYNGPTSVSGVTWAGGNTYYMVADSYSNPNDEVGIYKVTVNLSNDGKSVSSYSIGSRVVVPVAYDIEAIAYDPASGNVWVANESGNGASMPANTIYEVNPATGKVISTLTMPANFTSFVGNYGLESLTIAGDGLTMWTANEEALTTDGSRSSYSAGTTCRLVKFTRKTLRSPWECTAMYPYTTDKWTHRYSYGTAGRRGISDLCALPDGSLLVLERELSSDTDGTGIWAGLGVDLYYAIYQVTPEAMAAATDVKNLASLKSGGWSAVAKKVVVANNCREAWGNYEGICLGENVRDGGVDVVMVTDAGDGNTTPYILPNVLWGTTVRSYSISKPAMGECDLAGSWFRCTNGLPVSVALSGVTGGGQPYVDDGAAVYDISWTLKTNQFSNPATLYTAGKSNPANIRIWYDSQFDWVFTASGTVHSTILGHESFESYAAGATADEIAGWRDDDGDDIATVVELSYQPPTPPGWPLTKERHTKVLDSPASSRAIGGSVKENCKFEAMVKAVRTEVALSEPTDSQAALAIDEDGRFRLWCLRREGNRRVPGWVTLSNRAYAADEWVRIGVEFDYTGSASGEAFCRVRLNGSICVTDEGFRSPGDLSTIGGWHCLAQNLEAGGVKPIGEIRFISTMVDDFVYEKADHEQEHTGPTSVNGISFAWFDSLGLPRDPGFRPPVNTHYATLGEVAIAGVDPYADEELRVTGFGFDSDGCPRMEFNGYRGDGGFMVMGASSLSNLKSAKQVPGTVSGDGTKWKSVWKASQPASENCFYFIRPLD